MWQKSRLSQPHLLPYKTNEAEGPELAASTERERVGLHLRSTAVSAPNGPGRVRLNRRLLRVRWPRRFTPPPASQPRSSALSERPGGSPPHGRGAGSPYSPPPPRAAAAPFRRRRHVCCAARRPPLSEVSRDSAEGAGSGPAWRRRRELG